MTRRLPYLGVLLFLFHCQPERDFSGPDGSGGGGGDTSQNFGGNGTGATGGEGGAATVDPCSTKECECVPDERRCVGPQPEVCAEGQWQEDGAACDEAHVCAAGECVEPPSCDGLAKACGPSGTESCCQSLWVPGGTYNRSNDVDAPATVSDFRLDKYEITVGRFRQFVEAVSSGWTPEAGSGKHAHLRDGKGLIEGGGSDAYESGWLPSWSDELPDDSTSWDAALTCNDTYATWTSSTGANENRPINCMNWYHAYAFCIWDGGFLPSEAEWNYAAAGGSQQRSFAWQTGGLDPARANYDCQWYGGGTCSSVLNIAPVGSLPDGDGRWAQSDLIGNLAEMTLEADFSVYSVPCIDCAPSSAPSTMSSYLTRGGAFAPISSQGDASKVSTWQRWTAPSSEFRGARCARSP